MFKLLQPSIMPVCKSSSLPLGALERCLNKVGSGLTQKHQTRLLKSFPETNPLGYYQDSPTTDTKRFYNIGPWPILYVHMPNEWTGVVGLTVQLINLNKTQQSRSLGWGIVY